MEKTNERLSAALKDAKRVKAKKPDGRGKNLTSSRARKLAKAYWESQTIVPTATTRIHKDALELGRAAWKDSRTRIAEESEAIRSRARKALGM